MLGVLMAISAALIFHAGRGSTFHFDDWALVLDRREWSVDAFLLPHNEHLIATTAAVVKLLFLTVGIVDYWVYRACLIVLHLACVALLYEHLRRRAKDERLALVACVPILFLGAAWEVLLWAVQVNILLSLAAGLGMLLVLDRNDVRGDVLAGVFLAIALGSSTFGVPFAVAALFEALVPRPRLRRTCAAAIPVALYAAWYLEYGRAALHGGETVRRNLGATPVYVVEAAAGAFGALSGFTGPWGWVLLVVACILVLPAGRMSPFTIRFFSVLLALIAYWTLIGLGRAHLESPDSSRYLYVGAALVVLLIVERARDVVLSNTSAGVLAVLASISAIGNVGTLFDGGAVFRGFGTYLSAELGALELARPVDRPRLEIDPARAPGLRAGPYFDAVADLGSPADTPDEIAANPEPVRRAVDDVLIEALGISPRRSARPLPGSAPPRVERASEVPMKIEASCARFAVLGPGRPIELEISTPRIAVTAPDAPVAMSLRRFADGFSERVATLRGQNFVVGLPLGGYPKRWHVRLEALQRGRVDVCGAGPP